MKERKKMKPGILKIKGLNSFIEEQTIDFNRLSKRGFLVYLDLQEAEINYS